MKIEINDVTLENIQKNEKEIKVYLKEILDEKFPENNELKIEEVYDNMKKFIMDGTAIIIGAFVQEKIVGFIWAYEIKEKVYHINYFCVDKDYRNNGIGKKLLEKIYIKGKENKIKKIELLVEANNEKAIRLYEKEDFKQQYIKMEKNMTEKGK